MTLIQAFDLDPRDYALRLVDADGITERQLLIALLKYLDHATLRALLDHNELSPRFLDLRTPLG